MNTDRSNISISQNPKRLAYQKRFEEIYRKYFDKLYAYSRLICKSETLAKDVVSDFFFNLYKSETDFDSIQNLEVYLFVSVKNQAVQAVMKEGKLVNGQDGEIFRESVEAINPEDLLLEKELKEALDNIVASLPDQCQLIFRMSKERGMKYKEIAEELGISVETVKSQLKKAYGVLRSGIVKFYDENHEMDQSYLRLISSWLLLLAIPEIVC